MRRVTRREAVGGIFGAAAAVAAGCGTSPPPAPPKSASGGGKPVKPIPVELVDAPISAVEQVLKEQKANGNVVVVDFWAMWCAPCKKAFPHLVELHRKFADQGLQCVSVCLDALGPDPVTPQSKEQALGFLKDKGAAFPNFVIADIKAAAPALKSTFGFGLDALPYMAIFGRSGERVWDSDSHLMKHQRSPADKDVDEAVIRELAK